jgi:pyrimidine operon attenuation protein/uracil phosphoribosyltransferase
MTVKEDNQILNKKQVLQKIRRMAYEIYENNHLEERLFIAGVPPTGYTLAGLLVKELKRISEIDVRLLKIDINKEDPAKSAIEVNYEVERLRGQCLILVDDVLYTGRTFLHSLKPFLNIDIKRIETAVLVNRSHRQFPVSSNYTGYELSTTLNDHVQVSLEKGKFGVFLF